MSKRKFDKQKFNWQPVYMQDEKNVYAQNELTQCIECKKWFCPECFSRGFGGYYCGDCVCVPNEKEDDDDE